jgi:outer membrane protein assembly factor BamB
VLGNKDRGLSGGPGGHLLHNQKTLTSVKGGTQVEHWPASAGFDKPNRSMAESQRLAHRRGAMRAEHLAKAIAITTVWSSVVMAQDWPQWRGPNRDGAIAAFSEPASWPERLAQRWRVEVGLGYATPLLVGDRLYVFARQGDNEVMQALDAASGKIIWQTGYPATFEMIRQTVRHGPGPKSTPTYDNGRLFTLGMTGTVTAFDAQTGRQLWQKPGSLAQPMWHTAMSPVVDNDLVIVHIGGPGDTALAAFDVATGEVKWRWDGDSPAYGSPIVAEVGGTRDVVTFTQRNLVGVAVESGQLIWQRPFRTTSDTNVQTPILYRGTLIEAGRENGITAFRVSRQGATENLWHTDEVSMHMSNAVTFNGVLYGLSHLNSGQYFALDLDTGKVLWKGTPRQAENAAIVRADSTIFSLESDAELLVMRASRAGLQPLARYTVADSETWAQPVIAGNRIFIKDVSQLTLWAFN